MASLSNGILADVGPGHDLLPNGHHLMCEPNVAIIAAINVTRGPFGTVDP